jgi:hypothetical protein
MPSSHYFQLNEIVDLIVLTNPSSLLDIGVGFGKYGFLAREYLELWQEGGDYRNWHRQIDGIEAFEPYLTPVHDFIYDKIYKGNALEIIPLLETRYDLILMIDVFEHFSHGDGLKVLEECRKKSRNVLISVPLAMSPQEEVFGNRWEVHQYGWARSDFKNISDKFFLENPRSLICFMGEGSSAMEKMIRKRRLRRRMVRLLDFLHMKKIVKSITGNRT